MRLSLSLLAPPPRFLALSTTGCVIVAKDASRPKAAPGTVVYENFSVPIVKGANAFGSGSGALRGILYFIDQSAKIPELKGKTPSGALYVNSIDVPKQTFTGGSPASPTAPRSSPSATTAISRWARRAPTLRARLRRRLEPVHRQQPRRRQRRHAPVQTVSANANLTAGRHHIRVDYMQGAGEVELRLWSRRRAARIARSRPGL